jgi:hypothetical protein
MPPPLLTDATAALMAFGCLHCPVIKRQSASSSSLPTMAIAPSIPLHVTNTLRTLKEHTIAGHFFTWHRLPSPSLAL